MHVQIQNQTLSKLIKTLVPKGTLEKTQLQIAAHEGELTMVVRDKSASTQECELLSPGEVSIHAILFSKILGTYEGIPLIELEASEGFLRINSLKAPIQSWIPPIECTRMKGTTQGARYRCQLDRDELLGFLRSATALPDTEYARLFFTPSSLRLWCPSASSTIETNGDFTLSVELRHARLRELCGRKNPPQERLTLQVNKESETLTLDHWEGRVKIL